MAAELGKMTVEVTMALPKKETLFRTKVKKLFKSMGDAAHISWIESHATALGAPDLNYCIDGVEGWLELKASPDIEIRASQVTWMKERIKSGGYPLFFLRWDNMFLIVPGDRGSDLRRNCCLENALRLASRVWVDEIHHKEFVDVLKRPLREYMKGRRTPDIT